MGSINTDSTTINFNGANIKIATSGKGLIFADGTTLSSNTEIGGGGTANLAQVVNLGNATSNTMILENTDKTIVSSGNIESNIITTIIRFQEGSELPDGQGITLESAANNGNTISNVVQFSNGLVATSISGLDTLSFTSTNTTTPPLQLTASSLNDGVGALRIDSVEPDIYLNDTNGGFATVTFADNDVQRCAFGRNSGNDFYLTVRDPSTNSGNWRNDTFVADSSTGDISIGYKLGIGTTSPSANLHVIGNVHASSDITSAGTVHNQGFDFKLGAGDQSTRGDSGASRALVKDVGSTLTINYDGDFTGGVKVTGNLHVTGTITTNGAVYCSYGGSTGFTQTLTTSSTVLNFSTEKELSSSDHFTISNGVITVKIAGVYLISYNVGTYISSGTDRSDSVALVTINGTEYTNSRTYMYNRTLGAGENTGSAGFLKTLSANDEVAIYVFKDAGSATVLVEKGRSQISLYKINN
jgi:hypothetical protein